MAYKLPPLPYSYSALEPHIDAKTMQIHHNKHHKAYIEKLNTALKDFPELAAKSAESLLKDPSLIDSSIRQCVIDNGGGTVNHAIFWKLMSPSGGGKPTGAIARQINKDFGSFEKFKTQFEEAGKNQFGSGWVWVIFKSNKLVIQALPNQDNPISTGFRPIFGNDVWEHAYYLKHKNERDKYLTAWWNVINWDEVNRRFAKIVNK